jgi:hypothetical protein
MFFTILLDAAIWRRARDGMDGLILAHEQLLDEPLVVDYQDDLTAGRVSVANHAV